MKGSAAPRTSPNRKTTERVRYYPPYFVTRVSGHRIGECTADRISDIPSYRGLARPTPAAHILTANEIADGLQRMSGSTLLSLSVVGPVAGL